MVGSNYLKKTNQNNRQLQKNKFVGIEQHPKSNIYYLL